MRGFIGRRRRALQITVASMTIGAIGVGIVLAEDVWVNRPFVDVLAGTNSLYPIITRASKGDKLTVLGHEGKWLKVQVNGQEGYVMETALSTSEVGSDAFAGAKGESSGATAASAGKGFTADDFAAAKGYSEEPLRNLEAHVKSAVTPEALDKFMVIGKVGDAKPASHS
jgi:hypothetical protein